jgi:sugar O-acyltransferase (sialic acid O-acetyltransferase NeuD family)
MKRLAIIGSGDLGQQIAWYASNDNHYEVVGFFDDYAATGEIRHGLPILGKLSDVRASFADGVFDELLLAIGYKHFPERRRIFNELKQAVPFGRLIHSSAYVDTSATIAPGAIIYPGCMLDTNARIEENVLLNVSVVIAHDSIVGAHSFLSPSVNVAGFVRIGSCVNLGIGTTLIDNIILEEGVRTGAGAVVTQSLTQPGLYVGVPAGYKKP